MADIDCDRKAFLHAGRASRKGKGSPAVAPQFGLSTWHLQTASKQVQELIAWC